MRLNRSSTTRGESEAGVMVPASSSSQVSGVETVGCIWVSTQGIGCRRVASKAVLRIVDRHATSQVCRTTGRCNQVGIHQRELLSPSL